jgi:acyl-CoA thioesterase
VGDFEKDTRVTPLDERELRFRGNISSDWKIWGPNGGYLAAIALRAAGHAAKISRPASFSCHMLAMPEFREVQLVVEVLRSGRSAESIRVAMYQGERRILEALVRTALEGSGIAHEASKMPAVKPAAELPVAYELHGPFPFWNNLEPRTVWPQRLTRD